MIGTDSLRSLATGAPGRFRTSVGKVAQAAVAAAIAWFLAGVLLRQPQTVFAPFAAIVVLLGGTGGRGVRGVQVAVGVSVGVLVGEVLVGILDKGPLSVALGTGLAMLIVSLLYTDNLPIIQAGIATGIVVTADSPASGAGRLLAALLGVAVALLFTQVLFTPSPLRELERGIAAALRAQAAALDGIADALRSGHDASRDVDDALARAACALGDARSRARSMGRRTVRGRRQASRVDDLDGRAAQVAVLGESVLLVRRTVPRAAADPIAELAGAMRALAAGPQDAGRVQQAAATARRAAVDLRLPALVEVATGLVTLGRASTEPA